MKNDYDFWIFYVLGLVFGLILIAITKAIIF